MQIPQSEFQDQLIRGLSHKLNNILSLFHGYLGMLMEGRELDEDTRNGLARINEGAEAASELVDRTRALVRPSSLVWRSIPAAEFLSQNRQAFERCLQRGEKLDVVCASDLPDLWTDTTRLRAAVVELLRNAAQASGDGATVKLEAGLAASGNVTASRKPDEITISVHDCGAGIPVEIASRIFQPFFSMRHGESCHGLGLTVAAAMVQQLGGQIGFESEPGHTVFRISLPVQQNAGQ